MTQNKKQIGDLVLVGSAAYAIFSRTYRGVVYLHAEIGRPFSDRTTGRCSIISQMKAENTRDYLAAAEQAAKKLEELRSAQFQYKLASDSATITPLEAPVDSPNELAVEDNQEPLSLKLA